MALTAEQHNKKVAERITALHILFSGIDWTNPKIELAQRKNFVDRLLRETQPVSCTQSRSLYLPKQHYICPLCKGKKYGPLVDCGSIKVAVPTEIDHIWKMKDAVTEVMNGRMTIAEAYEKTWDVKNLRAVHAPCNRERKR